MSLTVLNFPQPTEKCNRQFKQFFDYIYSCDYLCHILFTQLILISILCVLLPGHNKTKKSMNLIMLYNAHYKQTSVNVSHPQQLKCAESSDCAETFLSNIYEQFMIKPTNLLINVCECCLRSIRGATETPTEGPVLHAAPLFICIRAVLGLHIVTKGICSHSQINYLNSFCGRRRTFHTHCTMWQE